MITVGDFVISVRDHCQLRAPTSMTTVTSVRNATSMSMTTPPTILQMLMRTVMPSIIIIQIPLRIGMTVAVASTTRCAVGKESRPAGRPAIFNKIAGNGRTTRRRTREHFRQQVLGKVDHTS